MRPLRLLSYNVRRLAADETALVRVIRNAAPDLVFIQEAPRRFRWRYRCASLARRCGLFVAAGGAPAMGNLLLASRRVHVHEDWAMRFPLTPGRRLRGAAFARCSVAGRRFLAVGSQLSIDPDERPQQAALLRAALSTGDEDGEPVLLGADLNDVAGSLSWRTLADGRIDAARASDEVERPTYSVHCPRRRADAIFVDPRCRVVRYQVLDSPEVRRASDHFPVYAEVELPESAATGSPAR